MLVLDSPASSARAKESARFDPDGSFWLHGRHAPDEFSDFGAINLNAKRLRRLPSPGLQLIDGTTFRFKTLNRQTQQLHLHDGDANGVSYSFSGRFLKGGVYAARIWTTKPRCSKDADEVPSTEKKWLKQNSSSSISAAPDRVDENSDSKTRQYWRHSSHSARPRRPPQRRCRKPRSPGSSNDDHLKF